MSSKLTSILIHALMLAVVCAIAAYWAVRVLTPLPSAAPPPVAAPLPREPDPMLASRMFGLVAAPKARVVSNVQVAGVFAAGSDSSAVLVVDGKPARVYLVGQEVSPGTRLAEVSAEAVVLEGSGGRQELKPPARPVAALDGAPPPRAYVLDGNTLSAPPGGAAPAPGPQGPGPQPPLPRPQVAPPPPQPGQMQPGAPPRGPNIERDESGQPVSQQ